MNRRSFLKGLLATSVAPAIVKAENIMRINPRIIMPTYPENTFRASVHQLRRYSGELAFVDCDSMANATHVAVIGTNNKILGTITMETTERRKGDQIVISPAKGVNIPIVYTGTVDHLHVTTPYGSFRNYNLAHGRKLIISDELRLLP